MPNIEIDFEAPFSYEDLSGRKWDASALNLHERRLVRTVLKLAKEGKQWPELSNYWRRRLLRLHSHLSGKDLVRLPVYGICQDIASRAGMEQGYFRLRDYRDDLEEIIRKNFASRYRFAKESGMDEAFLSRLLGKRAHVSIDRLDKAVEPLGYRVALVRAKRSGT